MTKFTPTPEQQAILHAAKSSDTSLMISALAGTAKTTTLEMIGEVLPHGTPALALAFNVKIKKELEKRFPPTFKVMTLNGLGHIAWRRAIGKSPIVEEKKLGTIITATFKAAGFKSSMEDWTTVRQLVASAMHQGLIPTGFTQRGLVDDTNESWNDLTDNLGVIDTHISFAREVLVESIKQGFAGTISFDEQIYLSALFGGVFPRFPLVLVDEAQDLSQTNHLQVKRCAAGRLIVAGDKLQSVYSFRGADSSSMDKLRGLRPTWIDLPLTVTFRCPRAVVKRQQSHAIGFTAAEGNAEGLVIELPTRDLLRKAWGLKDGDIIPNTAHWSWSDIPITGIMAVLCRNNAPLLSIAFKLLRRNIAVVMLGRDIGRGLIALSKKILPDAEANVDACAITITSWIDHECTLAEANDQHSKSDRIRDQGDCLLAALKADGVTCAGDLRDNIERLFAKNAGTVTLSTIHRAKGLEWDTVLHLDPWRIPSKWAKRAGERSVAMQQELNLRYVAETRAKHTLVLASLENFA